MYFQKGVKDKFGQLQYIGSIIVENQNDSTGINIKSVFKIIVIRTYLCYK